MEAQEFELRCECDSDADYRSEYYAAEAASMANEGLYEEAALLDEWFSDSVEDARPLVAAYLLDTYEAESTSIATRLAA
jgi:hypothetical protein